MTERELEKKLIDAVKKRNGMAYKFISPGIVGVPDRLVILPGNDIFFVEVKKPNKGKISAMQEQQLRKLKNLGCSCYILDNQDQIKKILDDIRDLPF